MLGLNVTDASLSDYYGTPDAVSLFKQRKPVSIESLNWTPQLWRCLGSSGPSEDEYVEAERQCLNCKPAVRALRSPNMRWSPSCE